MDKQIQIIKSSEGNKYFERNKIYEYDFDFKKISNLIKSSNLKANSILEIGSANGRALDIYSKLLKPKKLFAVELSKKAIKDGKKKYNKIKFFNISSLQIDKIKSKFDLIICGVFLYQLDRKQIFKQFDLISNVLNENGFLIIKDFDPLFKHSNSNVHNKKLKSFKSNYDNFLIESGLFELLYKHKYQDAHKRDKKKFKSSSVSLSLYKKIDFVNSYPENL